MLIWIIFAVFVCLAATQNNTTNVVEGTSQTIQEVGGITFIETIERSWDLNPGTCMLVAYDIFRGYYMLQIEVHYKGSCSSERNFYATDLLTPIEYIHDPFTEVQMPLALCTAQFAVVDIPDVFSVTTQVVWEESDNYSFIDLKNGYGVHDQYTCYQGWKFQMLGNACLNERAEVKIRLDSGAYQADFVDEGCIEDSYFWYGSVYSTIAIVFLILTCVLCCCLFCDCCLPCARMIRTKTMQQIRTARKIETRILRQTSAQGEIVVSTPQKVETPVAVKQKKEARERGAITTMEGQSRWLTFFLAIASALGLWLSLYPPDFEFDPYRVDLVGTNFCAGVVDANAAGYWYTLCRFINIFIMSVWTGVTDFVTLLPNYTDRTSPWYTFRVVVGLVALFCNNFLTLAGYGTLIFRWEFLKQQASVYYLVIVAIIHLLLADFFFVYVIILGQGIKTRDRKLERAWLAKTAIQGYNEDAFEEEEEEANNDASSAQKQPSKIYKLFKPVRKAFSKLWKMVKEEPGFRYSVFMLTAVCAAGNVIIFIFIKLIYSRTWLLDCLKDFNTCISDEMEKYIVFISDRVGIDQLYPLVQDLNVTSLSASDLEDTIAEIRNGTSSFLASSQEVDLPNVTSVLMDVVQMCDTFNFTDSGSVQIVENLLGSSVFTQLSQFCSIVGQPQISTALPNLDQVNYYVDSLSEVNNAVLTMLDQTEDIIRRSEALIVASSTTGSEWADRLDTPFQVASYIGFTIGLIMGLSVLYITLVSYKRINVKLTLEKVLKRMGNKATFSQQESLEDSLERFTILSAIYFFGIVLSTSAIQMYIFSFFLTFVLTVLFSPWLWTVFLKKYYGYIVVYVSLLIINAVIIKRIGNTLLYGKHAIKRPALWLAYYIIFSFAYLLLGILFAVYRIVYLLLTTLISISRLDKCLFSFLPQLDNGHNSFMGMVLMAQAMTNIAAESKKTPAAKKWGKLRQAVQTDDKGDFLQKVRDSVLPGASLFGEVSQNDTTEDFDEELSQDEQIQQPSQVSDIQSDDTIQLQKSYTSTDVSLQKNSSLVRIIPQFNKSTPEIEFRTWHQDEK